MNSPYIVSSDEATTESSPRTHMVFTAMVAIFAVYLYTRVVGLEAKIKQVALAAAPQKQVAVAAAQPTTPPASPAPAAIPPVTEKDHIRGSSSAQLLLVEYSDMECPFCKRFDTTMKQVLAAYPNKVAWVYRHLPLSFHANAQKEAEAAECAADQGGNTAFWKYTDAIFARTESGGTGFALDALVPLAGELGLDKTVFKSCLDSGARAQKVKIDVDGATQAGISGTPTTIILSTSGKKDEIGGALPFEDVKKQLDALLK